MVFFYAFLCRGIITLITLVAYNIAKGVLIRMDSYNIIIYGNDNRQLSLAANLPGKKAKGECKRAGIMILPTPLSKLGRPEELPEAVRQRLELDTPLTFAGAINQQWSDYFNLKNIPHIDLMKDEGVALRNAHVTAEATLAIIIEQGDYAISDEKYLITGYGRCAQALARKLAALGAKVTILARSSEARRAAVQEGYNAVPFSYGPKEAYGTRCLINTVPAPVVGKEIVEELRSDSLIIDIASISGCDQNAIQRKGIRYLHELGLPGRYLTKTSGKILADCVLSHLHSQQKSKEGMPWIFQILE